MFSLTIATLDCVAGQYLRELRWIFGMAFMIRKGLFDGSRRGWGIWAIRSSLLVSNLKPRAASTSSFYILTIGA